MLLACKTFFRDRVRVLGINIVNTYREETAYFANNWANVISTTVYTFTYLAFVHILYSNVTTIAGYTRDEMLFFTLVGQFNFYTLFSWSDGNLSNLIQDVNRGNLDLILTRPLPHLFYVSTRRITLVRLIRDSLVPIVAVYIVINWNTITLEVHNVLAGLVVMVSGLISFHVVQFYLALPVFWKGEAQQVFNMSYVLFNQDIPYEGYPLTLRTALTVLVPIITATALTTSVMLGKTDAPLMAGIAVCVALVALLLRRAGWRMALRNYSSASS